MISLNKRINFKASLPLTSVALLVESTGFQRDTHE